MNDSFKTPTITVLLVGQPNVGKTHLLNTIGGVHLKVGNFSGVTVEKAEAIIKTESANIKFIDLPGTYSLDEFSKDEQITKNYLINEEYDLILNVVDSTNLERNLFLTYELLELDKKMVIAMNMSDEAKNEKINIDEKKLSILLGVDCIKVSATQSTNINLLVNAILECAKKTKPVSKLIYNDFIEEAISDLSKLLEEKHMSFSLSSRSMAIGLLKHDNTIYKSVHENLFFVEMIPSLNEIGDKLYLQSRTNDAEEIFFEERQSFVHGVCVDVLKIKNATTLKITDKIDAILLNKNIGIPIFLFMMWALFQMTFTLGSVPMDWIESSFTLLGNTLSSHIENEILNSLIIDGVIAGVGAVMMFLPNIMILFLGIALLETTGYMARVSFLLDGFLHGFGLHGKSFIPLISGFGCSVPAYMAARTLKSEKERLLTMFIIGFMSCGAKLPVYVLFAGAFFAPENAGNVLFSIYIGGALLGLGAAKVLSLTIFKGADEPYVMEMPKYRLPSLKLIWFMVYSKALMYLKKAGTYILVASMIIWFVSTYPHNASLHEEYAPKIEQATEKDKVSLENELALKQMESTYLGVIGKTIEPIFSPLGFDWKMSVATLSGLAAKEVIVSTMGVLYSLGSEVGEDDDQLKEVISKHIPFESAVAFIVFVMIYLPCLAATAVFSREAGNKKYTIYLVMFTFIAAWILSFVAYHIASFVG
ncbi:MAG: ferrous iron transport protein B [Sulfurimonas sp.]|nr:ferrous iron transport protein B [Sulfurimonas sp.]